MQMRTLIPWLLLALASSCQATAQARRLQDVRADARKASRASVSPLSYEAAITAIAEDIERLKKRFPQLIAFSSRKHCDRKRLVIEYDYRTHASQRRGGWTSAVPNPDSDGVWLYIDFHDPNSMAQIHTQPVVPALRYGEKKVTLLILEGARTRHLAPALMAILRGRGVTEPAQRRAQGS